MRNPPVRAHAEVDRLDHGAGAALALSTDGVLHAVITAYNGRSRDEAVADVWLQLRAQHPGRTILVHHADEHPNVEFVPIGVPA